MVVVLHKRGRSMVACADATSAQCRDTLLHTTGIVGGIIPKHVANLMWRDKCQDTDCFLFASQAAATNGTVGVKITGAGQHFQLELDDGGVAFAWALPASAYLEASDEIPEVRATHRVEAGTGAKIIPFHVRYLEPSRTMARRDVHLPPPLVLGEDGTFLDLHIPVSLVVQIPVAPGDRRLPLITTVVTLVVMVTGLFVAMTEMRRHGNGGTRRLSSQKKK